jgi:hypothetical protein
LIKTAPKKRVEKISIRLLREGIEPDNAVRPGVTLEPLPALEGEAARQLSAPGFNCAFGWIFKQEAGSGSVKKGRKKRVRRPSQGVP